MYEYDILNIRVWHHERVRRIRIIKYEKLTTARQMYNNILYYYSILCTTVRERENLQRTYHYNIQIQRNRLPARTLHNPHPYPSTHRKNLYTHSESFFSPVQGTFPMIFISFDIIIIRYMCVPCIKRFTIRTA